MSRFAWTTLVALGLMTGAIVLFGGWMRVAAAGAVAGAFVVAVGCGVGCIGWQFFMPAACRGKPAGGGRMRVALTFDDGPNGAATPRLLELLKREGIEAAFFCVGKRVLANPLIVARMTAEGHVVGNHSYHHWWWGNFMGAAAWRRELERAQEAIGRASGVVPTYMRPPMGLTSPSLGRAVRGMGLNAVGWDVRSLDTVCGRGTVLRRIRRGVRDGSIILLHDGGAEPEELVALVQAVIQELRGRGYGFERLDRLLGK